MALVTSMVAGLMAIVSPAQAAPDADAMIEEMRKESKVIDEAFKEDAEGKEEEPTDPTPRAVQRDTQVTTSTTTQETRPTEARSSSGPVRTVSSTAYCLTGKMANGQRATRYSDSVAVNNVPFGTRYRILSGPWGGRSVVVRDRIGHSSQFDVGMPGNCASARQYGRRTIQVQRVN